MKYTNLLFYSIFGFLASVINVVIFDQFHTNLHSTMLIANTIAWFISNLFSFFANKHIVFKNDKHSRVDYLHELGSFFSARAFSWVIDMGIMYIGVWIFPTHPVRVKIFDQVLVGIINYLVTKIIFTHNNRNIINRFKRKK
ncbi:GtrA family protein [Lactobacillus sp. YT155]|uniref:GtrA family protein n=1 Tax=Lactobacillus sp. YT155 TaxID=3060955 RepID=UPI00265D6765|nr:GtrA family protein [Lactobacillus sp. YT155]MDO1605201.1 GtrA family protein [Lactobacillus sp. YT155]